MQASLTCVLRWAAICPRGWAAADTVAPSRLAAIATARRAIPILLLWVQAAVSGLLLLRRRGSGAVAVLRRGTAAAAAMDSVIQLRIADLVCIGLHHIYIKHNDHPARAEEQGEELWAAARDGMRCISGYGTVGETVSRIHPRCLLIA